MNHIVVNKHEHVATLCLQHGKVNAINKTLANELDVCLSELEKEEEIRSVILTGSGPFFSFGLDIPTFLSYSPEEFTQFLFEFTRLYTRIFLYPKPIVAALNGHTMAGGCMLAVACDWKIMVTGNSKIALNEINFGSSVFASAVEILAYSTGRKNAEKILYSGALFLAEEAMALGIIDQLTTHDQLLIEATKKAHELGTKDPSAFYSIKKLLRQPTAEQYIKREAETIHEVVKIWYSEKTWANLQQIKIK